MTSPASEPAVPGATGAKPQPNHVAIANAVALRRGGGLRLVMLFALAVAQAVVFEILGLHWRRDHIFLAGPIAEVDQLAAFAAKGIERAIGGNFFFADGALHRAAVRIGNAFMAGTKAGVSVGGSSVPIRS